MYDFLSKICLLGVRFVFLAIEAEIFLMLYFHLQNQYRELRGKRSAGRRHYKPARQDSPPEVFSFSTPEEARAPEDSFSSTPEKARALEKSRLDIPQIQPSAAAGPSSLTREDQEQPAETTSFPEFAKPAALTQAPEGEPPKQDIRLGLYSEYGLNSYGTVFRIVEKPDGELKVHSQYGSTYYVQPYGKILTEQQLNLSAIPKCFSIMRDVENGKKYRFMVDKDAVLIKEGEAYRLQDAGKLTARHVEL